MSSREVARGSGGSLATRAALALVLMVGFYVLALGIAGALVFIPYAELTYLHRIQPKLALLCLGGAALILWSIVPRPDRFEPPGALLAPAAHAALFAMIDELAAATGQARPAEVYLVHDMNAWVSSRGGWMGIGSRRIMGVGLPLLQRLTVSQLRGVLAHEFGHYHGGDVKLGPWIYKTRAAIGRTVGALARAGAGLVHRPFVWYGNLFLRLTHSISRNQELDADALSARVVGREAFVSGMKAVHGGSAAFDTYWQTEVEPVLGAGYRPPLARGFSQFLSSRVLATEIEKFVAASLENDRTDPYDTHPAIRERIARVEAMQGLEPMLAADDRPAIDLLGNVDRAEVDLLLAIARDPAAMAKLRPIEWDLVGHEVWLASWRRRTAEAAPALGAMTPASAPTARSDLEALGRKILGASAQGVPADAVAAHAASIIAAATACLLEGEGWTLHALPGDPVGLRRAGVEVQPFAVMMRLARGQGAASEWTALHQAASISDRPLATTARAATDAASA
jgi:Zn-dependent protease with chaperone function